MTADFLDRAWVEADRRRTEHLTNPHRAAMRTLIEQRVQVTRRYVDARVLQSGPRHLRRRGGAA